MYQIKYDGEVIANVPRCCVETPEPTPGPTRKPTPQPVEQSNNAESSGGGGGSSLHRCVANDLAEAGYLVKNQFCDKFVDCYNQYIATGDDWFCNDDEVCIEADACGGVAGMAPESEAPAKVEETVSKPQPPPTQSKPGPNSASKLESSAEVASVGAPPTTDKPTPKPTAATPKPIDAPITAAPSAIPTSMSPTESPTEIPTLSYTGKLLSTLN